MQEEIVRGDKKTRIKFFLLFIGTLIFLVSSFYYINYLFSHDNYESAQTLEQQLENLRTKRNIIAVPYLVIMGIISVLSGRTGWKVLRSGMFPAPGMKVPFDTKRKKGAYAKAVGILYLVFLPALYLFWTVFFFLISGEK